MYKYLNVTFAVVLASSASVQLHAQPAAQETPRADNFVLEEVIVTANRREQKLQEVAMSISAFGSQFFEDSGVTGLTELEQYTPSLNISTATDARIRGSSTAGLLPPTPVPRRYGSAVLAPLEPTQASTPA